MHAHLTNSDDVDANLYPALLQVFTIILLGYFAGTLKIVNREQATGLNVFVGTFILPALLLKNIWVLDFSTVDWYFLGAIFISKTAVFTTAIFLAVITIRPVNIGLAAIFAIYVSQSNDFALGQPIVHAIYHKNHPEYMKYIYLIAPISLCILNPIAFFLLELNEQWSKEKPVKDRERGSTSNTPNTINNSENDISQISVVTETSTEQNNSVRSSDQINMKNIDSSSSFHSYFPFEEDTVTTIDTESNVKKTQLQIIKKTLLSTISNPIVFMTFLGIVVNFAFKQKIPALIEPILSTLSNSFSAIALFYLGMNMVGRIKNLTFSGIVIIMVLIFSKSLFFPLITREMVVLLEDLKPNPNMTKSMISEQSSDLSTFGFLYGTFPSAPSLLAFIGRYKAVQQDLISSAIVFGTLASAPLMMASGKMISINYLNNSSNNFVDIQCKTAYGFSFATWFCCIWVLYIFLASGRVFMKPHCYTFFLILSQMLNSLVHILWASATNDATNVSKYSSYSYVFLSLFAAYMTRCIPLSIAINLISITKIRLYNQFRIDQFVLKFIDNRVSLIVVGFFLPLFMAWLCIAIGGIPEKQGMMISVGKGQIIISIVLLTFLISAISYCLILFARTKFHQSSILSIVTNDNNLSFSDSDDYDDKNSDTENIDQHASLIHQRKSDADLIRQSIIKLNIKYQIMQHISLVVISLFVTVMCLFVQLWSLNGENVSGIFYELQLLDTTLLYGQGFFLFMCFGLDNEFIFAPFVFKLKEVLKIVAPYRPLDESEIPEETREICEKFERQYKNLCARAIEKNQRFHYKFYVNVFSGSDLIDWMIAKKLIKSRLHGEYLGKKLLQGHLIHHVSKKRDFYDGFHLYKFY